MTLTSGTKLGRYEIRSKIGEGGMAKCICYKDETLPQCNRVETDVTLAYCRIIAKINQRRDD